MSLRPVIRTWLIGLLFLTFMGVLLNLTTGCAARGTTGVPWTAPVPDYSAPQAPTLAPEVVGACETPTLLSDPCTGLLLPPAEAQYLYDVDSQREPVLDLLGACAGGRASDRLYADQAYARILAERDKARRQRWETFAIGGAVGAGIVAGIVTAVAVSSD